jgi:hypothetical protein
MSIILSSSSSSFVCQHDEYDECSNINRLKQKGSKQFSRKNGQMMMIQHTLEKRIRNTKNQLPEMKTRKKNKIEK